MEELLAAIQKMMAANQSLRNALTDAPDLQEALATRRLVQQAKRIVMEQHNISEADALRHLQQVSREQGQTIKAAAQNIVSLPPCD